MSLNDIRFWLYGFLFVAFWIAAFRAYSGWRPGNWTWAMLFMSVSSLLAYAAGTLPK